MKIEYLILSTYKGYPINAYFTFNDDEQNLEKMLTELGNKGWELIGNFRQHMNVFPYYDYLIFKRCQKDQSQ